jgi:soluble lytic murein transglycosylase-like protein
MIILLIVVLFAAYGIAQSFSASSADSSGPGGVSLGPSAIAVLAANAGFSGEDLAIAIAVALSESSGNPSAYNPETASGNPQGKGSYGLWQINLNAHPEFAGQNLYDPATNANAAFSVYSQAGGSFRPWTTYQNGAYKSNLPVGEVFI